jgi:hypothetical protein
VRKRSSRVAVASLSLHGAAARSRIAVALIPLLGAVARIHAGRSYGRHRVRQRRIRFGALFLLAVAILHRVRSRSSCVAVASRRLLGAAAAIHVFFAVSRFLSFFLTTVPKFEADRQLFLMCSVFQRGGSAVIRSHKFRFSSEGNFLNPPLRVEFCI